MLKKPKMILFDYGQTLIDEVFFDGVKGTTAVMQYATKNKYHLTPEQVQQHADEILKDLGRFDRSKGYEVLAETHNHAFQNYLYRSLGIEISLSLQQMETIFWNHATDAIPTEGIVEFLEFLHNNQIRTGVISNISFSGVALSDRIHRILPMNHFEFIIASSEVIFRKPSVRIFNLALEMADLKAEDVWYCGDNLRCDVVGSNNTGMTSVWYKGVIGSQMKNEIDPDIEIDDWNELIEALSKL